MARQVKCPECGILFTKTKYPVHLKEKHNSLFENLLTEIKNSLLKKDEIKVISENLGVTINFIKKISSEQEMNCPVASYGVSKPKTSKRNRCKQRGINPKRLNVLVREGTSEYRVNQKKINMEPKNFSLETTTVWGFPDRGQWATHNPKYRGNWSPYIPRNIIMRYSHEGDTILDQFVGSGTTMIEAKLLNRNAIGVDINPTAIELSKNHLNFNYGNNVKLQLYCCDARKLDFINDESIDLICTHPPYSNIIKYSEDINGDLSHLGVNAFVEEMKNVAVECFRVLKKDKFCAVLIGDTRKKGSIVPIGFRVMEAISSVGFKLKEIVIKEQHNCSSTGYWRNQSIKYNFLLIAHEYLFIFKK